MSMRDTLDEYASNLADHPAFHREAVRLLKAFSENPTPETKAAYFYAVKAGEEHAVFVQSINTRLIEQMNVLSRQAEQELTTGAAGKKRGKR